ncbi:MAG TPA: DUF6084 family protein [Methylomirabilota bacterium]|jgi:Family of unknown function (DUF6084)|nr:DUF6084 family protein [Methylomirabilota bacterium]
MPDTGVPELAFTAQAIAPLAHAATPALGLTLDIRRTAGPAVQALALHVEVRIALARRAHDDNTRRRLAELFGAPAQWHAAPRALTWLNASVGVPAFEPATTVVVPLPCTYDFDVTATKYFHALPAGEIPLDLLFTGSVFYTTDDGRLRTARLPWDREASFDMPVRTWRELMDRYFADRVWMRLPRETFDRLWAYRTRHALPTWEHVLDALLHEHEAEATPWMR